jgi:hypothetical protein
MMARRLPVVDWYVGDEESAVLSRDQVVVLSAMATDMLRTLDEDAWIGANEVSQALVAAFGEPPDGSAEAHVRAALEELAGLGLVALR